jgi:membrane protein DedA with SNARE-associated domain
MWKKLIIAFFYNAIKSIVRQLIGGLLGAFVTVPDDLVMAVIGYLIHTRTQYRDEGEALLISAVASLGSTAGLTIGQLFGGGQAQTVTATTTTATAYEVIR